MSRPTHEIDAFLIAEITRTKGLWDLSKQKFTLVVNDIPSGLPSPDGVARIKMVAAEHNFALRAYSAALNEFNEFIIDGKVPDRLLKSMTEGKAGADSL